MEIDCKDFLKILDLLPSAIKDTITDQCPLEPASAVALCGFITRYLPTFSKDECVSLYTGVMQCACSAVPCPTGQVSHMCPDGKTKVCATSGEYWAPKCIPQTPITISAKILDALFDKALTIPKVTDFLKKNIGFTGTTRSDVCQTLVNITDGDWALLAELITDLITDKLPANTDVASISTLVSKYTPRLFGTVCVGLKPQSNLPVENNATYYNWIPIMVAVAAVVVLALIPMLCVVLSKSTQHKLTYYLLIVAIVSLILVAVFVANPICLFKTCYQKSQTWKQMKGQYTGKGGAPGLDISINGTFTFKDLNSVVFDKLECTGSLCSNTKDLLIKCKSPAQFNPMKQTTLGYELTGDCIDGIKSLISGGSSLDGIYLAQVNDPKSLDPKLYVQIKVTFRKIIPIYAIVLLAKV